jgi:hypothetical protein
MHQVCPTSRNICLFIYLLSQFHRQTTVEDVEDEDDIFYPPSPACSPAANTREPTPVPHERDLHSPPPSSHGPRDNEEEDPFDDNPPLPLDADDEVLLNEIYANVKLADLRTSLAYILGLQTASLDDTTTGLSNEAVERLRNPPTHTLNLEGDPVLRLAVRLYLELKNADEDYLKVRAALKQFNAVLDLPSISRIKSIVTQLSGVEEIVNDICPKKCIAYTGPFARATECPECGEVRYDELNKPRQRFSTFPIGPQLQAMYQDPHSAAAMQYRNIRTQEIFDELTRLGGLKQDWHDFLDGQDYVSAVADGKIKNDDIVVMMSVDGAQLFRNKMSDCWMGIWVVFNRSPETRYKKNYVLPAFIIPGPEKPKNLDSFLYPGLHHLSALMQEGLRIWDAARSALFTSHPFLALGTADRPGLAYLNGLVGHQGKRGCCLYCGLQGRRKKSQKTYYAAHARPSDPRYDVSGCTHPDVDLRGVSKITSAKEYWKNLIFLLLSPNESQYRKRRLETGISKPSIFLGLPANHTLGVPTCFGSDIMHLLSLNIPDLLIPLWRGTFECDSNDHVSDWPWAVLRGETWERFGEHVASATSYLPGCFDRPPRNPAEKINSGYKAWEYTLLLYGLGPMVLYGVLPFLYWQHFCKLIRAVRLISQYHIERNALIEANELVLEFIEEFEELYYQRKVERLHFTRQSIHALVHYGQEVFAKGPLICASQWTMERTIGNLVAEIRQPSNPYANLT